MSTWCDTTSRDRKRPRQDRLIPLDAKRTGKRSAGNLHAAFDVAGAGNGIMARLVRHSQRKRGEIDRPNLPSPRQPSTLPPVKVQDRSRTLTRTGRFWVYLGDPDHPCTVFTYTPSRSRDGPMAFLRDWGRDERVYLQADAFGGYDGIYAGEAGGHVTEVACWAHVRRKFYDARTSDPAGSAQALALSLIHI